MSPSVIDKALLGNVTSRVVKSADYERLLVTSDVLEAARGIHARQQEELEAARQEAAREGFAAGVEFGKAAWARELVRRQVEGQAVVRDMRDILVASVMNALRHLVSSLPDESRFELLARQVLDSAARARHLRLVVAAADAASARGLLEGWQRERPELIAIDVMVDSALVAGDCVLETDEGAVDGRLRHRLSLIEEALLRSLPAAPNVGDAQ